MGMPASAFTRVALRSLPRTPARLRSDQPPEPLRRGGAGLLLAALLAWMAAGREGTRS